jgi:hypothetical protein
MKTVVTVFWGCTEDETSQYKSAIVTTSLLLFAMLTQWTYPSWNRKTLAVFSEILYHRPRMLSKASLHMIVSIRKRPIDGKALFSVLPETETIRDDSSSQIMQMSK